MARPRWHDVLPVPAHRLGRSWDRFVAIWATINLLWVFFDLSYVPLRIFWLQRNLYPIPSAPLALPMRFLPDVTPWMDPIKGIEGHRETQAYQRSFNELDQAMLQPAPPGSPLTISPDQSRLLRRQIHLNEQMIDTNPFEATGASGTLEKIKFRLRNRANLDSAKESAAQLLDPNRLNSQLWKSERRFWNKEVLPLVATNYWRSIDNNGRPTDHFWRYDLVLFQSVFLFDILLRAVRLRRRLPGLSWNQALLRRWIDLPLLLPFWRWLRVVPVLERLQTSGLINIEPLRAVISRGVVALLAVELFEVLALQLLDGLQQLIRSRRWPERIRSLRSDQSVVAHRDRQLLELVRIWGPILLVEVAPRLAPELQGVLGHALQRSLQSSVIPTSLRGLQPLLEMEKGFSRQLAVGMVESLIDLSRSTGDRLGHRDDQQLALLQRCLDRFWEELAASLEQGPNLERSQQLLCALLEAIKRNYLSQINRAGIEGLIEELDELMSLGGTGRPGVLEGTPGWLRDVARPAPIRPDGIQ
jgi:hypothetical protein